MRSQQATMINDMTGGSVAKLLLKFALLNDTPFLEGRSTTIFSAMFYLFSKHR